MKKIQGSFNRNYPVVIVDDSEESGRAALSLPASLATPDVLNTTLHLSTGSTIQVALSPHRTDSFSLEPMGHNRGGSPFSTPTTLPREMISVEAREGVTTGISMADRSKTVMTLGEDPPQAKKIVKPGHIFPIRTREGGVLVRSALPEAALDTVRLSGFTDAACFLDVFNDDGEYRTGEDLKTWSEANDLLLISLSDIVQYRLQTEKLVYRIAEVKLPTRLGGEMKSYLYRSDIYQGDHLALVKGTISTEGEGSEQPTLVRVQPESTFRDVFGDGKNMSSSSIEKALVALGDAPSGVFVYLRRPDQGPLKRELSNQSSFHHTKGSRMKEYGLGAQILRDLGVTKIRLLTNTDAPSQGLDSYGLEVVETQPLHYEKNVA